MRELLQADAVRIDLGLGTLTSRTLSLSKIEKDTNGRRRVQSGKRYKEQRLHIHRFASHSSCIPTECFEQRNDLESLALGPAGSVMLKYQPFMVYDHHRGVW